MYLWAPDARVLQPAAEKGAPPPPEDDLRMCDYRALDGSLRPSSLISEIHTVPTKGTPVASYEMSTGVAHHRILALLRPDDPGRDALEAIVRPVARRGLQRPLDEDARRFLQRALHSPSPDEGAATPETPPERAPDQKVPAGAPLHRQRSLAEELREAEERAGQGAEPAAAADEAAALGAAAARLDALLAESRTLHRELAAIHRDLQTEWWRAGRCSGAARVLLAETRALHFLDDVVALLRGDVAAAARARAWPFALGQRQQERSYVV